MDNGDNKDNDSDNEGAKEVGEDDEVKVVDEIDGLKETGNKS